MEKKNLEELAKKIAEQYGVSLKEATTIILNAMTVIEKSLQIWQKIRSKVFRICEEIKGIELDQQIENKQAWPMVWDTRKKSQVILNKPKFAVLKIIK